MSTPSITFYKIRDFGEKMGITIDFLRENFKKLFLSLLLIGGPFAILLTLLFADMFNNMFDFSQLSDPDNMGGFFAKLGLDYVMMMVLSWLAMMMIVSLTYTIFKRYNTGDLMEKTTGELFSEAVGKIAGLMLLSFIIFIVVVAGMFLFVIPGIYLMVALSLAYPIYMFEEDSTVGSAFSKSFSIISGKWWSTFGILFVGSIMASVAQIPFSIPFLLIYFMELFSIIEEVPNDPSAITGMFTSGYMTIAMAVSNVGGYIAYAIPLVALGFQYSNLIERKEGKGLLTEIDDFDKAE